MHPVVLFLADQRTHLGFALEGRAELDVLGFLGHGFDEPGVDFFLDQDAAAGGTDLALVDEHAEEGAIDGGFPVGFGKENIRRFAAKLEGYAFQCVGGALDDDFADRGAAGEGHFVDPRMRYQRGTGGLAEAIDNVDNSRWQAHFFQPIGQLQRGQRSLLGGLENAGATSGERRRQLPGGHEQRIVPRNDLRGHAHRLAQGETQRVGRHGIDVPEDLGGQTAVVFETGGHVGDVIFGFHDGLAGVAGFEVGKAGGILANFLGQLEQNTATILCGGFRPGTGVKGFARGFYRGVDIFFIGGADPSDYFFGGRIVNGKGFSRCAGDELAVDIIFASANFRLYAAGHYHLPIPFRTGNNNLSCRGHFIQFSRRFAPAVHKKEKRRQAHKQERAAEHPDLVREDGGDLRGGEKGQRDAQGGGDQPAGPGKKQGELSVLHFAEVRSGGNFQERSEHVQEGNQLQHNRER